MAVSGARAGLAAVVAGLLVAGVFTACSTMSSEAEQFCSQLDGGAVPMQVVGQIPGAEVDPMAALTRARDAIRSTCPQHEAAAASFDAYLTGAPVNETDAVAPTPRTVELRVEGTVSRATVSFGAGGTNGGGDPQKLPWTRSEAITTADLVSLTAVTVSGVEGTLSCSITDAASGEVLARQVRESGGESSGYASVVCQAGQNAAPAAVDPPLATTAVAKPTTRSTARTTPVRPVTRDAADAESDALKSCMVRTGQTEAQCRVARGGSGNRLPSAAEDPTGNLRACMEQTGMSASGCRAASARGEGG